MSDESHGGLGLEKTACADLWIAVAIFAAFVALYVFTTEKVINDEGLKYVMMMSREDTTGYLEDCALTPPGPDAIVRTRVWRDTTMSSFIYPWLCHTLVSGARSLGYSGDGRLPLVVLSAVGGGAGVALLYLLLGLVLKGRWLPLILALGMGTAAVHWMRASGVERHVLPVPFIVFALWCAYRLCETGRMRYAILAGVAQGLSIGFHLQVSFHVAFFAPFMVIGLWPRGRRAAVVPVVGYLLAFAITGFAEFIVLYKVILGDARSVFQILADYNAERHANMLPFAWSNLIRIPRAYAETFVVARAHVRGLAMAWTVAKSLAVVVGTIAVAWLFLRDYSRDRRLRRQFLFPFIIIALPTAAAIPIYYHSDPESMMYLLPLFWLAAGLALRSFGTLDVPARHQRVAIGVTAIIVAAACCVNLVEDVRPRMKDSTVIRSAMRLAGDVPAGSLVISRGYDWIRYMPYYTREPIQLIWLVTLKRGPGWSSLDVRDYTRDAIERKFAEGGRVFVYGLLTDRRHEGWLSETAPVPNISPEEAVRPVLESYSPRPVIDGAVWELTKDGEG